jgi:hypothetical protein
MAAKEEIVRELETLLQESSELLKLCSDVKNTLEFGSRYQHWYSRALKLVSLLGSDRLEEFRGYYLIAPKRKVTDAGNYVIQDYIKGLGARLDRFDKPLWDVNNLVGIWVINQLQILKSLSTRIEGVLADVEGRLLAELADRELTAAQTLAKVSLRAAGSLAGVVLERHLQRVAANHEVKISKRTPTIADLNDPLKQAGIYDTLVWRKVQLLADLRDLCSHNKHREPTAEEVEELLSGVNTIVKSVA